MKVQIEESSRLTLLDFIGEYWSTFESYCEERGEGLSNEVYEDLGGEPE